MSATQPADESTMASTEGGTGAPVSTVTPDGSADDTFEPATDGVTVHALAWTLTNEPNPFHRRLVFTEAGETVLDLSLDPLVVQDLIVALGFIQADQRRALGLRAEGVVASEADPRTAVDEAAFPPAVAGGPAASDEDGLTDATDDATDSAGPGAAPDTHGSPLTLAWWWRHKLLAFLLLFAAVFAGVGALTGTS